MKQLLYTLICAMFIPALMNAAIDRTDAIRDFKAKEAPALQETSILMKANTELPKFLGEKVSYVNGKLTALNGFSSAIHQVGLTSNTSLINYDEFSKTVTVALCTWDLQKADSTFRFIIHPFTNNGANYDSNNVFSPFILKDTVAGWYSFNTLNPKKSTNVNEFHYTFFMPYTYTKENKWSTRGNTLLTSQPDKKILRGKYPGEVEHPKYSFQALAINAYLEGTTPHILLAQNCYAKENSGAPIGVFTLGIADDAAKSLDYSTQQFFKTEFKDPEPNGHWNSKMMFDTYKGTVYYGVNNLFKKPVETAEVRIPAVAKSTDGGYSFSEMDRMPIPVMEDFITEQIRKDNLKLNEVTFFVDAYDDMDFKVYGEDKMSMIASLRIATKNPNAWYKLLLIEINKEGSNWKVREVENLTSMTTSQQTQGLVKSRMQTDYLTIYRNEEANNTLFGVKYPIIYTENDRKQEVEIAMTEDGQYLVAKWLEHNYDPKENKNGNKYYEGKQIKLNPPFKINIYNREKKEYEGSELPTLEFNNIYVKYRKINEDKWSDPVNLTQYEQALVLHSHMPKVIPSIKNIPLIYTITYNPNFSNWTPKDKEPYANFIDAPENVKKWFGDRFRMIYYGNFTVEGKVNVETEVISKNGVAVFPNPAASEMTIKIDNNTPATVEIFNMLGDKLMQFDNVVTAVPANVSGLANGMYVIKVNEGGKIRSSSFTIAR